MQRRAYGGDLSSKSYWKGGSMESEEVYCCGRFVVTDVGLASARGPLFDFVLSSLLSTYNPYLPFLYIQIIEEKNPDVYQSFDQDQDKNNSTIKLTLFEIDNSLNKYSICNNYNI